MLIEVEANLKLFLAYPTMMSLGLISIKLDVICTKLFPACFFLDLGHNFVVTFVVTFVVD
jgi:hypothetical protein